MTDTNPQTTKFEDKDTWQMCCDKLFLAVNALHERLNELENEWEDKWSRRHEP